MPSPFQSLPVPAPDPIFAIMTEAVAAGTKAINCTIGVVMDEDGQTTLLPSVQRAINDVMEDLKHQRFGYPPLLGVPAFRSSVERLIFGEKHPYTVASIASTGGTGALAINLRLMAMLLQSKRILLPSPAWANHPPPCVAAGLAVIEVPYLENSIPTVQPLIEQLKKEKGDVGLLLQAGSHNPTGIDLENEQWADLVRAIKEKGNCIVLLDCAYQGLKHGVEKDVAMVHLFLRENIPTLVTWSAAKNHSIYALRPGLACAVVPDATTKSSVEGHYSRITRSIHSASSTVGQLVVARVQEHYKEEWLDDLKQVRTTLARKRKAMIELIPATCKAALRGFGMFAMLPLTQEQILRLKNEHNVFMTLDGRINIAGIPDARIGEFCAKVRKVVGS
ncbi:MAG: aminotransferase class I/II-fold pyridoxal phosphate-dependent enzyme [Candidatus Peribacteraceae bacterium]|nr:aminotransferase class I/II-fold pyridoxal phosphate-dependent enzyme [Candidatus Peribacteraceae bacterium]